MYIYIYNNVTITVNWTRRLRRRTVDCIMTVYPSPKTNKLYTSFEEYIISNRLLWRKKNVVCFFFLHLIIMLAPLYAEIPRLRKLYEKYDDLTGNSIILLFFPNLFAFGRSRGTYRKCVYV